MVSNNKYIYTQKQNKCIYVICKINAHSEMDIAWGAQWSCTWGGIALSDRADSLVSLTPTEIIYIYRPYNKLLLATSVDQRECSVLQ